MDSSARTERWNRLKELFVDALERSPAERDAFVAASCGADDALRKELDDLLRAADVDDNFIEQPASDSLGWTDKPDAIGQRVGPYRIIELAGRGGWSLVYRATREGAEYERQVAIKLLLPGFGNAALLRRFSAERRMLAALTHPNIAHFIDGGATEDGTPYLVMEFVEGRPLDAYCDEQALSLEARIDLVRVLCGAVHYVHQHLMVHGDLKGNNVLVTSNGVVKLLDFGIAKLMAPDPSINDSSRPATLMMMTPDYASPEQLRGEAITTASDVYSLGALLYRVLTGATPYGTDHAAPAVIMERMSAGAPMPPAAAAERSGGTYAAFASALRGDLGPILLKALKVDPRERYGSAQQLADDLRRWLRGFPVEARPESSGYRVRKWAQRHRAAAVLSVLAVTALVGGIAATSWQAHLARLERERAERNFTAVRELSSVFLADVYQSIAKIPGSTEARKLLVDNTIKYMQALERDAPDSPELRRDLGMAYERLGDVQGIASGASLGDSPAANAAYRRSVEIRKELALDQPSLEHSGDLLRGEVTLLEALLYSSQVDEAKALGPRVLRHAEQLDANPKVGRTERRVVGAAFTNVGGMEWSAGNADAGLKSLGRARDVYQRIVADYPSDRLAQRDLAMVTGRLGEAHAKGTGRADEALRYYQETVALLQPLVAADPRNAELAQMLMNSRATVGEQYNTLKRPEEGLRELEAVLPDFRRMRAADPADQFAPLALAFVLGLNADSRLQVQQFESALAALDEAASLIDPKLSATVPDVQLLEGYLHSLRARAHAGMAAGDVAAAERDGLRRQAEREGRRALGLLEPLIESPQTAKDAQRHINSLRAALEPQG